MYQAVGYVYSGFDDFNSSVLKSARNVLQSCQQEIKDSVTGNVAQLEWLIQSMRFKLGKRLPNAEIRLSS